jgi:hypothetical protein
MPLNTTVKVHRIDGQKTRGEGYTNGHIAAANAVERNQLVVVRLFDLLSKFFHASLA